MGQALIGVPKRMAFAARLKQSTPILCAEGYLFELERRGYVQAGLFTPEVTLEDPTALRVLHSEFLNGGSDVVVPLTYYAHREKLRQGGLEDKLEDINRA